MVEIKENIPVFLSLCFIFIIMSPLTLAGKI